MDNVDRLYQCYETLASNPEKIAEHEEEYLKILEAVKGENNEKLLACQFIPKFFKNFPLLSEKALDAQLDLIEDEDVTIRKQAIKNLPSICKESSNFVPKVADILTQMLIVEDSGELAIVNAALVTILKFELKPTLQGIFSQIKGTEEEIVRKRAIAFICNKLKLLPADMVTKDVEEFVLKECKDVFHSISTEEFESLISMLTNLKAAKTLQGQQLLLEVVMVQVDLEKEFNHENTEAIVHLLQCIRSSLPFYSQYVSSAAFVKYIALQAMPSFQLLSKLEGVDLGLECIKALAEISPHANNLEEVNDCLEEIYKVMLDFVPLPSSDEANDKEPEEPNYQFTHIEGLMYAFYQLLKKDHSFLTSEDSSSRYKDFKVRLTFLARNIQNCMKRIRDSMGSKSAKPEDNKMKAIALCTMSNINSLVKDLFHNPPLFKASLNLSWKQATPKQAATEASPLKRKAAIATREITKIRKDGKSPRELYSPPGGKFSGNMKFYPPSRGFGGFRGRGNRRGSRRFY